jgi:hypothetical protein
MKFYLKIYITVVSHEPNMKSLFAEDVPENLAPAIGCTFRELFFYPYNRSRC